MSSDSQVCTSHARQSVFLPLMRVLIVRAIRGHVIPRSRSTGQKCRLAGNCRARRSTTCMHKDPIGKPMHVGNGLLQTSDDSSRSVQKGTVASLRRGYSPVPSNTVTIVFGIDAQSADMANQPRRSRLELESLVYIECPSCHRPVAVLADRTRQERFVFCLNCLRGWNTCLDRNDSPTFPSPSSTLRRVK